MLLPLLKMAGGIALLTVGAEFLVTAAVSLARRVGLSPLIIGLTVVSLGTSMPELVVSFDAVLRSNEALGVGNVVGSNITNIALILGISALVRPMRVEPQVVRHDGPILIGVSLLLVGLTLDGALGHLDGAILAVGVLAYFVISVRVARTSSDTLQEEYDEGLPVERGLGRELGFLGLGLAGLVGGADVLVEGAVSVAEGLDVPQVVIGLSVVAVGTSLPELATSMLAARRGEGDIAIGNAVGSSILNILGILGFTAVVFPLSTASLTAVELVTMVGVVVLVLPLLRSNYTLSRWEGSALLVIYGGYIAYLFLGA